MQKTPPGSRAERLEPRATTPLNSGARPKNRHRGKRGADGQRDPAECQDYEKIPRTGAQPTKQEFLNALGGRDGVCCQAFCKAPFLIRESSKMHEVVISKSLPFSFWKMVITVLRYFLKAEPADPRGAVSFRAGISPFRLDSVNSTYGTTWRIFQKTSESC